MKKDIKIQLINYALCLYNCSYTGTKATNFKLNKLDTKILTQLIEEYPGKEILYLLDYGLNYHAFLERKRVNKTPLTYTFLQNNHKKIIYNRQQFNIKYNHISTHLNYLDSIYIRALISSFDILDNFSLIQTMNKDSKLYLLDDFNNIPYNDTDLELLRTNLTKSNSFGYILLKGLLNIDSTLVLYSNLLSNLNLDTYSKKVIYYVGVEKYDIESYNDYDLEILQVANSLLRSKGYINDIF